MSALSNLVNRWIRHGTASVIILGKIYIIIPNKNNVLLSFPDPPPQEIPVQPTHSWFVTKSTNMAAIMTSAENLKFCTFIRDRPAFLLN